MDETANGVREQLVQWFARDVAHTGKSPSEVADAILARWDLTEKPVVAVTELGRMVNRAATFGEPMAVGGKFLMELERAGLTIVRRGEGAR